MSLEFVRPEERAAIDIRFPLQVVEQDWRQSTERLATDCLATAGLLTEKYGEILPDNYSVAIVAEERDLPFNLILVQDPQELRTSSIKEVIAAHTPVPPSKLTIWLKPIDDAELAKPLAAFDNDDETVRLYTWGPCRQVTVRGIDFTVRQQRSWLLWNYHAAKRKQGYSEEDYPGSEWQPDYSERVEIAGGENEGCDLVALLLNLDEEVRKLTEPPEATQRPTVLDDIERRKRARMAIMNEVYPAVGFTPQQTFGPAALQEAHNALAAIRNFIA